MKSRTLWDEPFGMLMACGSPGSAYAYHLGQAAFDSGMTRRNMTTETPAEPVNQAPVKCGTIETEARSAASRAPSNRGWFSRVFDRLDAWFWERSVRESEAYLAQAQNLYDLEARMRHIDGSEFSRRGWAH